MYLKICIECRQNIFLRVNNFSNYSHGRIKTNLSKTNLKSVTSQKKIISFHQKRNLETKYELFKLGVTYFVKHVIYKT